MDTYRVVLYVHLLSLLLGLFGSGAYMTSKVWTVPRVAAQAIPEP